MFKQQIEIDGKSSQIELNDFIKMREIKQISSSEEQMIARL